MNKKIIGILVIMLLLISSLLVTGNFKKTKNLIEKNHDNDPTWKISSTNEIEYKNLEKNKSLSYNLESIEVEIVNPTNGLYLFDKRIIPFIKPLILGPITIQAEVTGGNASKVEFYIDDDLKRVDYTEPFEWKWEETSFLTHTIMVKAYSNTFSNSTDQLDVSYYNFGSQPDLSKDEAIDILINAVIKPDTIDHIVYAFTLNEPLQVGDKTSAWLPEPVPVNVETAPYPEYRTTTVDEWFFYIDDLQKAYFCHPVRFVFINAMTAEIEVNEHYWWPILNDKAIFHKDEDYLNPDKVAYTNDNETTPPEVNIIDNIILNKVKSSTFSYKFNQGEETAIIINGNNGSQPGAADHKENANQMAGFFLQLVEPVQQLTPENKNNSQSDIEKAFGKTKDHKDCVVYICGHGGTLDDSDHEPYLSCGDDLVCEYELCNMQAKNPNTEYKYVIQGCYSGNFIESLKNKSNTRKVITACGKNEKSYTDCDSTLPPNNQAPKIPDPNPKDKGSEFTSGFVEDLYKILNSNPNIGMVELLDQAYISACEKDVTALNGVTHPRVWERIDDPTSPKVEITKPKDGGYISSPTVVQGSASDLGGSGVVLLDYKIEWDGGSYDGDDYTIDPPLQYLTFELGPIYLENYIVPGDFITITINATDDVGNTGSDSVTVTWQEEPEDTTPPVTEKTIGEPNEDGGYVIWPFTPITFEATDDMSGVKYIYYEVWWDSNEDEIVDMLMAEKTVYDNIVTFSVDMYGILINTIELRWYAVDNADNVEEMHYQQHYVNP